MVGTPVMGETSTPRVPRHSGRNDPRTPRKAAASRSLAFIFTRARSSGSGRTSTRTPRPGTSSSGAVQTRDTSARQAWARCRADCLGSGYRSPASVSEAERATFEPVLEAGARRCHLHARSRARNRWASLMDGLQCARAVRGLRRESAALTVNVLVLIMVVYGWSPTGSKSVRATKQKCRLQRR